VERFDKRGMLAGLYVIEALLTLALAALLWRFSFAGVLVFVAIDGTVAVAATALVRASTARAAAATVEPAARGSQNGSGSDAVADAQRQANGALNVAFMVSLWLGPAIGGALVHWLGGPVALVLDAVSFLLCAALVLGLRIQADGEDGSTFSRLRAAWQHLRAVPALRILLITEAVAVVVFASVEPVEVVYAKSSLHVGDLGFGLLVAAWGFGAAVGAIAFSRSVHRPLGGMLTGGAFLVGLAYLGFAAAPTLAVACVAAVIGGAGNGIQWPSFISAVQQLTPGALHGRLMSVIGSLNALCPALGFALGGTIAALTSPRVAMLVAGIVTMVALHLSVAGALKAYGATLYQLRWAIVTVMAVLALAFVMNASGQTITLGTWMAGAGGAFALISPILGWLGTAVTGSDTSSNSLFGALQVTAAAKAGLSPVLMAAGNSSGGVLGKMISPQNLAIASAAVEVEGREGDIFRRVFIWSLVFLAFICALSGLQASVLSWMVP